MLVVILKGPVDGFVVPVKRRRTIYFSDWALNRETFSFPVKIHGLNSWQISPKTSLFPEQLLQGPQMRPLWLSYPNSSCCSMKGWKSPPKLSGDVVPGPCKESRAPPVMPYSDRNTGYLASLSVHCPLLIFLLVTPQRTPVLSGLGSRSLESPGSDAIIVHVEPLALPCTWLWVKSSKS